MCVYTVSLILIQFGKWYVFIKTEKIYLRCNTVLMMIIGDIPLS